MSHNSVRKLTYEQYIDKLVAEALGFPWIKPSYGDCCTCQDCGYFDECMCGCSTELCQAEKLLDLARNYRLEKVVASERHENVHYRADIGLPFPDGYGTATGDTLPMAICLAFLLAKGVYPNYTTNDLLEHEEEVDDN